MNYTLIGGQAAGGDDRVFASLARDIEVGGVLAKGFLVADPDDVFRRRFGHARLALSEANTIASVFQKKDANERPLRWTYRGVVYRDGTEVVEELDVYLTSYSFSSTVRIGLQEAPPQGT